MKIPKPIVDEYFEKIVEHFRMIMSMEISKSDSASCRTPYYIIETLEGCIKKNRIEFWEYIMFLKLCKLNAIFHFWTQKEKNIIIQNVKETYDKSLDLLEIKKYLDRDFKSIVLALGYDIDLNKDIWHRYALRLKEKRISKFMDEDVDIEDEQLKAAKLEQEKISREQQEHLKNVKCPICGNNVFNDSVLSANCVGGNVRNLSSYSHSIDNVSYNKIYIVNSKMCLHCGYIINFADMSTMKLKEIIKGV